MLIRTSSHNMSTVERPQQWTGPHSRAASFTTIRPVHRPVRGHGRGRLARGRPRGGRRRRRRLSPSGRSLPPPSAGASCSRRRPTCSPSARRDRRDVTEETGGTFGWGMFNCDLAAGMLREAAAQTYAGAGEVIPSDVPGARRWRAPAGRRGRRDRALERARSSSARARSRTPLAFGNTVVLKASEIVPAHARQIARALAGRRAARRASSTSSPTTPRRRRRRRGADRPPGGAADQLHRLDARRPDRRREGRPSPEARAARAGRQGAADRAGGRRPRRGGRGRQVRRVHAPGPDLHVDRADRRRQRGGGRVRRASWASGRRRSRSATRATPRRRSGRWSTRRRWSASPSWSTTRVARAPRWSPAARPTGPATSRPCSTGVTPEMRIYSRGVVRAGRGRSSRRRGRRGGAGGERHRVRARRRRSSARTCRPRSTWPAGSRAGSATSTARRSTTSRRCRSAASRRAAWGRFGGRAAIEEFTELRWITVQQARGHYPI